jgi:hypothetical protein
MEAQFSSDLSSDSGELDCFAVDPDQASGGEDAGRQALASWEERERRRIEFRSSLMNARVSQAAGTGREVVQQPVQQSVRQLSAEMRERRPARMMAELANAH